MNNLRRRDLSWTPELSRYDKYASWSTHAARIFLVQSSKLTSALSLYCPVCLAEPKIRCYTQFLRPELIALLRLWDSGEISEEDFSSQLLKG